MLYEEINLKFEEKLSLFSFKLHKRKPEEKIKCYRSLYFEYSFIKQNRLEEVDENGEHIFDGTYSLSDRYYRYLISRRKYIIAHLPNWIAILISLISLIASTLSSLLQLGIIKFQ